jgi:hypothetical protein
MTLVYLMVFVIGVIGFGLVMANRDKFNKRK